MFASLKKKNYNNEFKYRYQLWKALISIIILIYVEVTVKIFNKQFILNLNKKTLNNSSK